MDFFVPLSHFYLSKTVQAAGRLIGNSRGEFFLANWAYRRREENAFSAAVMFLVVVHVLLPFNFFPPTLETSVYIAIFISTLYKFLDIFTQTPGV